MKNLLMLLKREYWENKVSIIKVPVLLGFTLIAFTILSMLLGFNQLDININTHITPHIAKMACTTILLGVSTVFNIVLLIAISYYSLSALFEERKDRSILFWKSLPLSETNMVFAKLITALVVTPVATWVVMMFTSIIALLLATISLTLTGNPTLALWQAGTIFSSWGHIFLRLCLQSLGIFPMVAWFMLCSAYAKRSPFLLAIIIPIVLVILEKMLLPFYALGHFVSYQFQHLFIYWHSELSHYVTKAHQLSGPGSIITQGISIKGAAFANFHGLLTSPYYWISASIGIIFIAIAIVLRNTRYEC